MKKIKFTIYLVICALISTAQNTSVNIGFSGVPFDSTFVVPAGATMTFNNSNHPGAGPYMNAEILLCQGSTLNYNYSIGTSNLATFYMDNNSTLVFPTSSAGTMANFYVKNGATFQIPYTVTIYAIMKRETGVSLLGIPISTLSDSIFSNINFTFNGWANPCSPNSIHESDANKTRMEFQNPIENNIHILSNPYSKPVVFSLYNYLGQCIHIQTITPHVKELNLYLPNGFLYYTLSNEATILQTGKLMNPFR